MATLNELAYNIKNIAYGGNTNTEQNVSTQQRSGGTRCNPTTRFVY